MSWNTSQTGSLPHWISATAGAPLASSPFRMRVNPAITSTTIGTLSYISSSNYQFKSGKTYQFVTNLYYYMNN